VIPPAALQRHSAVTTLKLLPYRADYSMSDQVTPEVNTAADLARLRNEGHTLSSQELKELNARVRTLEEMARLEDRLKALENRKRPRSATTPRSAATEHQLERQLDPHEPEHSANPSSVSRHYPLIRPSIELDDSESSSSDTMHQYKRRRYTKGIKITPSYTLKVSSSLREWGDWKRDIERVFEGDPETYWKGTQKILKALDYLEPSLKSLWYTYSEQKGSIRKWPTFLEWTRDNIQNGQNATATLYEQLNAAKQLPNKSPMQFNAYLAAIERDLPQQNETASAMTFYSKLTKELKRQFKTSDIAIPETRAKCVAVAQRVWEGLYGPSEKRGPTDDTTSGSKYPRIDSSRDRKDRYHLEHRSQDDQNKEKPRNESIKPGIVCFSCNKPGHYASSCPDRKESSKKAKIQAARQEHSPSEASASYRSSSELPRAKSEPEDSDDSLN
jgi:hypothetical protein